ncbi:MAG: hypothetical protein J7L90_02690 [Dehalococcoidia bacterium]|nr:hypothetical protein [Dehalococcoidia bacterium]
MTKKREMTSQKIMATEFGVWVKAQTLNEQDKVTAHEIVFEEGSARGVSGFIILDTMQGLDRQLAGSDTLTMITS